MNEQEKKRPRIYDLLNAEIKTTLLCLQYTKQRKNITKKVLLMKRRSGGMNKKRKYGF